MAIADLYSEIVADLGDNFVTTDLVVLESIIDDVIEDALRMSNRDVKASLSDDDKEEQVSILHSNIKKAVKTIYLQRGVEDVTGNSVGGLSNTYDVAMETMMRDIIRQNKRLLK